jgi:DHA3 family macrolide efflux protein-like MFS transporter
MTLDTDVAQRNDPAPRAGSQRSIYPFILICLADLVSLTGSQLTAFGLGVWIYQRTGSTTIYGWVALATLGPSIIASPFAGVLVDRSTRLAMLLGHAGAGLCSLLLAILFYFDALHVEVALGVIAMASICNAVQFPGLSSAIPRLVRPELLGRANGAVHFGAALGQIVAPAAAAAFLVAGGMGTILIINAFTFLFAIILLLAVRIPPAARIEGVEARPRNLLDEVRASWEYIRARPGFLWMLALIATTNFNVGVAQVLLTPFVLGFADVQVLGLIRSAGGIGMVMGGGLLMLWGGPQRRVNGVLCFALLESVFLMFLGLLRPSAMLAATCAFGVLFAVPLLAGCSQTIWQRKVHGSIQGSVFAVRFVIAQGVFPFAFVLAGPLADRVFEPLMNQGGFLSSSVGSVLGTGPGRGMGLIFVVLGLLGALGVALAATSRSLRCLEDELPDDGLALSEDSGNLAPQTQAQPVP